MRDHPTLRALARVEVAAGDARAAYNERRWAAVQQALAEAAEAAADAATTVARATGTTVPLADLSPRELLLTETLDAALCELAAARRQVEDARAEADRLGDLLAAAEDRLDRGDSEEASCINGHEVGAPIPCWNPGGLCDIEVCDLCGPCVRCGDDKPGEVTR